MTSRTRIGQDYGITRTLGFAYNRGANGNKREAARILGIGIATLYRKMKKHGISD